MANLPGNDQRPLDTAKNCLTSCWQQPPSILSDGLGYLANGTRSGNEQLGHSIKHLPYNDYMMQSIKYMSETPHTPAIVAGIVFLGILLYRIAKPIFWLLIGIMIVSLLVGGTLGACRKQATRKEGYIDLERGNREDRRDNNPINQSRSISRAAAPTQGPSLKINPGSGNQNRGGESDKSVEEEESE